MTNATKTTLEPFIQAAKSHGASDEFLINLLSRSGWPAEDIYELLRRHWEGTTGVAIPRRITAGESSRDAFLYLFAFATLCTWACSLGSMLFHFVDRWLPDPISDAYAYTSLRTLVSWQMASVAVAFPIFLLTTRAVVNEAESRPESLQSGVRKWLTYIALLLTAGTMIGDLICTLGFFLQGELTSRSILKGATVLCICAGIFAYYLGSLRKGESKARSFRFATAASLVVLASLATGFTLTGTPSAQRLLSADAKRQQQLRVLASSIQNWNNMHHQMPSTLTDLQAATSMTDPETGRIYEYRLEQGTAYQLCANFHAGNDNEPGSPAWRHSGGHFCYTLDAARQIPW